MLSSDPVSWKACEEKCQFFLRNKKRNNLLPVNALWAKISLSRIWEEKKMEVWLKWLCIITTMDNVSGKVLYFYHKRDRTIVFVLLFGCWLACFDYRHHVKLCDSGSVTFTFDCSAFSDVCFIEWTEGISTHLYSTFMFSHYRSICLRTRDDCGSSQMEGMDCNQSSVWGKKRWLYLSKYLNYHATQRE